MHWSWALLLAAVVPAGHAEQTLDLRATPRWAGVARLGAVTEVEVAVLAPRALDLTLEVGSDDAGLEVPIRLRQGERRTVSVPYAPTLDAPFTVRARVADRIIARLERRLVKPVTEPAVVAVAAADRAGESSPRVRWVDVSARALPRTPRAYDAITALVIDAGTLAYLDAAQQRALEHYLADCGRVAALAMPPSVSAALRRRAGCGGELFAVVAEHETLLGAVSTLLRTPTDRLPDGSALRTLGRERGWRTAAAVLAFLGFYGALIWATAAMTRSVLAVTAIPVAATLFAVATWYGGASRNELIVWTERVGTARLARYSALLVVRGAGYGKANVVLPVETTPTIENRARVHLRMGDDGLVTDSMTVATRLLSRQEVHLTGAFEQRSPLALGGDGNRPLVRNTSSEPVVGSILVWRGEHYRVPELGPGQRWEPSPRSRADEVGPVHLLLSERVAGRTPALLVPLNGMQGAGHTTALRGWLLLRESSHSREVVL